MNVVKQLLEQKGVLQKEFAIDIGVSQPTVSDWIHNKKDPRGDNLQRVADYFNVSTSVIKGLNPIPEPSIDSPDISDIDFALSGEIRDLTDAEKQDVLDYVRFKRAQKARQEAKP